MHNINYFKGINIGKVMCKFKYKIYFFNILQANGMGVYKIPPALRATKAV